MKKINLSEKYSMPIFCIYLTNIAHISWLPIVQTLEN